MCRKSERLTPFVPRVLTAQQRAAMQRGTYATYNFTNRGANERGLRSWTTQHRNAWELARLDDPSPARYDLDPAV